MKSRLPRWFKVIAVLTIFSSLLLVCSIVLVKAFRTDILPEHSKIDVEITQESVTPVDVQREPQESVTTVDIQRELSPHFDVIRKVLQPGMQLYTIKMHNVELGVGDMLVPGCFVDVLVSSSAGNREDEAVSKALLKKVQVISVECKLDKPIPLDKEGKTSNSSPSYWKDFFVTLALDTKQAEQLQLASRQGSIKLVRHPG